MRWILLLLSTFMAGLGIGSWGSGRLVRSYGGRAGALGLRLYALAELLIGVSALLVPLQLRWGRVLLENAVVATTTFAGKQLLVNGVGMTSLNPITKIMAHLPMAFLNHPPQNSLNICFGMGTTFRSLISWGVPATAVELVPSVPRMFSYYHADGQQVLRSPLARVVIDDGRRYLERFPEKYDVITIDPPPPIEAAASSMLYSKEFYAVIKQRLRQDGILQQWLPEGDPVVRSAVARALYESFPYVRIFQYFPDFGFQFLASSQPIPNRTGAELLQRMPAAAVRDLVEWPRFNQPRKGN